MRKVRFHQDFEGDLRRQLDWLAASGEGAWITNLTLGIQDILTALSEFPAIGSLEGRSGTVELRAIRFRRGPYRAWYLYDEEFPGSDIWLVRLFHSRQRRVKPDPSRWLPRQPKK